MRVLLLSQYFTPEITAAAIRLHPFAATLAGRGHEVDVVCEVPSHPTGVVHPGYGGRLVETRELEGFRTTYIWTLVTPVKPGWRLLTSYASYAAVATAVASARPRPDLVLASSPPLSVGAVGSLVAARHRVPWVLDVRDLWPEVAVAVGALRPGNMLRAAEWLERRLYASAAAITTPTEAFRETIASRSPDDPGKVAVIANGAAEECLAAGEQEVPRLGEASGRFVWTYSGNVGPSQDLGTAVEAARLLGDGFELRIVGDGAAKADVESRAASLPVGSVRFEGLVDAVSAASVMRASDALLVPLVDDPALAKSIPVKFYDCCAVGRPVIVAAPGETRRIAAEEGIAVTVPPGDPGALADVVKGLRGDEARRIELGSAARRFAARHRREGEVDELERLLGEIALAGRRRRR